MLGSFKGWYELIPKGPLGKPGQKNSPVGKLYEGPEREQIQFSPELRTTEGGDRPISGVPPYRTVFYVRRVAYDRPEFWIRITDSEGTILRPEVDSDDNLSIGKTGLTYKVPRFMSPHSQQHYHWISPGTTLSSVQGQYPATEQGAALLAILKVLGSVPYPWKVLTHAKIIPQNQSDSGFQLETLVSVTTEENETNSEIQSRLQAALKEFGLLVETPPTRRYSVDEPVIGSKFHREYSAPLQWVRGLICPPSRHELYTAGFGATHSVLDSLASERREKLLGGEFILTGPPVGPEGTRHLDDIPTLALNPTTRSIMRVENSAYFDGAGILPILQQLVTSPGPCLVIGPDSTRLKKIGKYLTGITLVESNTEPSVTWVSGETIRAVANHEETPDLGVSAIASEAPAIGLFELPDVSTQTSFVVDVASKLAYDIFNADTTPDAKPDGSVAFDMPMNVIQEPSKIINHLEQLNDISTVWSVALLNYPTLKKDELISMSDLQSRLSSDLQRFLQRITQEFEAAVFDTPAPVPCYVDYGGDSDAGQEINGISPEGAATNGEPDQYLHLPGEETLGFGTYTERWSPPGLSAGDLPLQRAQKLVDAARDAGAPITIPTATGSDTTVTPTKAAQTQKEHAVRATDSLPTVSVDSGRNKYVCTVCRSEEASETAFFETTDEGLRAAIECHGSISELNRSAYRHTPDVELALTATEIRHHELPYEALHLLGILRLIQTGDTDPEMDYAPAVDSATTLRDEIGLDAEGIDRLHKAGYLIVSNGRPHRLYSITKKGLEAIDEGALFDSPEFSSMFRLVMESLAEQYLTNQVEEVPGRRLEVDVTVPVRATRNWQPSETSIDFAVMEGEEIIETVLLCPPATDIWGETATETAPRSRHDGLEISTVAAYRAIQEIQPERATWVVWQNNSIKRLLRIFDTASTQDVIEYDGGVPSAPRLQTTTLSEPGISNLALVSGLAEAVESVPEVHYDR